MSARNGLRRRPRRLVLEGPAGPVECAVLKVLVVDDSQTVQQSLGRLLGSVPGVCLVGYATDVAGAIERVASTQPDVVVLDVDLGEGQCGIDVLAYVRREHPATQVIALSNLTGLAVRTLFLDAGAQAYFDKGTEFAQARDWVAAQRHDLAPG